MAGNMLSNRPVYGRTFHTAMWMIGLIAAAQLFAVIRAVMSRPAFSPNVAEVVAVLPPQPIQNSSATMQPATSEESAAQALPPSQVLESEPADRLVPEFGGGASGISISSQIEEPRLSPSSPGAAMRGVSPGASNPLPEPSFFGPSGTSGPSLSESLSIAADDTQKIEDPILERLVSAGEELRATGNMSGALQALREAEDALPEHPRVLGELAATYRQMGRDEKATVYWEKILSLGSAKGGAYYQLANRQLRGEMPPTAGAAGQVLKIGKVEVTEYPPDGGGQKVSLRIVVDGDPGSNPVGSDMSLLVYFYDLVEGQTVDPSTADTSYDYPTKKYDWVEGTEAIIVDYEQPLFTEEERRELGERAYYGYVIELYYRDQLQDRIEMPEELSQFRMSVPQEPARMEPENALFPETPSF